jgi:hypothetical protein
VARDWLQFYFANALLHCPFKAFIVEDGVHQQFPYPGDEKFKEHAGHALLSCFVAGLAWSYSKAPSLLLRPVFDDSDNMVDREIAISLPGLLDVEVSERRVKGGKRYPLVTTCPTEFVESDPLKAGHARGDSEFVQLCDLLLGACYDALKIRPFERSRKTGRIRLASSIAEVLAETVEVPWFQHIPVHRRFSVSLYPDEFNLAYPAALRKSSAAESSDLQQRFPF